MPLNIPTAAEQRNRVILRMLARDVALTDLTQGSVLRILLEEMGIEEFQRLYAGLDRDQRQWFINSAEAEHLDRRVADFGLIRHPARAATGFLKISNTAAQVISIQPGTIYRTQPDSTDAVKRYQVLPNPDDPVDGVWTSSVIDGNETVIPKVEALTPGPEGNTPAATIVTLENLVDPFQETITNELPLVDGRGVESDSELRERFRKFLDGLTRGTRASIRFHLVNYVDATGARPVKSVALVEWGGQSLLSSTTGLPVALKIYIEDGTGSASAGLVAEIQTLVDGDDTEASPGLHSAGIPTEVLAASPLPVTVVLRAVARADASPSEVKRLVEESVRAHIGRLPVAGQLITGELQGQLIHAQLFREVMNVPGVLEVQFAAPTANVPVPIGRKAMPTVITVTVETV